MSTTSAGGRLAWSERFARLNRLVADALQGPREEAYDPGMALVLAKASEIAYTAEPATVPARLRREAGFEAEPATLRWFERSADHPNRRRRFRTQAYVVADARSVIACFRGTEPLDLADWMTDFDYAQVAHPVEGWGRVHHGFLAAVQDVWRDEILPYARTLAARGDRQVYITGHSLGGALALLAATLLDPGDLPRLRCVATFGQPRVGDETFSYACQAALGPRVFRHVCNDDLVPRVPPALRIPVIAPVLGLDTYRHVGVKVACRVSYGAMDRLVWADVGLGLATNLACRLLPPCIRDHVPEGYVQGARLGLFRVLPGEPLWAACLRPSRWAALARTLGRLRA